MKSKKTRNARQASAIRKRSSWRSSSSRITHFAVRLCMLSALFTVMILINVAVALAQVQSHRLSEVSTIDTNLNMGGHQIIVDRINSTDGYFAGTLGVGTESPTARLSVNFSSNSETAIDIRNTDNAGYADMNFYDSAGSWRGMMGYGNPYSAVPGVLYIYAANNQNISFTFLNNNGSVGIGTIIPVAKLTVNSDDWRAGAATLGGGDISALGPNAVAVGTSTNASGSSSLAAGSNSRASGDNSVAVGLSTNASGSSSLAAGSNSRASGNNAVAVGISTYAGGEASFAGGELSRAEDGNAFAMGAGVNVSGYSAASFGRDNNVSGHYSFATGWGSRAHGFISIAMGESAEALGHESIALGHNSSATSDYSIAMGSNMNVDGASSFGISLEDGPYTVSASNVMSVMGGRLGVGTTAPSTPLHVQGMILGNDSGASSPGVGGIGVYGTGSNYGVAGDYVAGRFGILGAADYGAMGQYDENHFAFVGTSATGIYAHSSDGPGVWANGSTGVWGFYNGDPNQFGELGTAAEGVHGASVGGYGVHGQSEYIGIFGEGSVLAGLFNGNVNVSGNLTVRAGDGIVVIDGARSMVGINTSDQLAQLALNGAGFPEAVIYSEGPYAVVGNSTSWVGVYGVNSPADHFGILGGPQQGAAGYYNDSIYGEVGSNDGPGGSPGSGVYGYYGYSYSGATNGYLASRDYGLYASYNSTDYGYIGGAGIGVYGTGSSWGGYYDGDVFIRGPDGFNSAGEQALVRVGDTNHFIRAIYAGGLVIGSANAVTDPVNFTFGGTTRFSLSNAGEAYCYGSDPCWNFGSSREIKENISELGGNELEDILEELDNTPVYSFSYKADESHRLTVGLIAEDAPDLINGDDKKYLSGGSIANYLFVVAKAQQMRMDELAEENAALKQLVCLDHPEAGICK